MQTRILPPSGENLSQAAKLLQQGELVAFPTETVYGLGANALDENAVKKIYEAKGRPARNPIIVHVSDSEMAKELTTEWPEVAEKLTKAFWPGPLTIVLRKTVRVPSITTAGSNTVAIRCPAHPVARALIEHAGVPLAAPSANLSGSISPTLAAHVLKDLDGKIPMIVDGGPVPGGIESTVIDLTTTPPRLLRPGLLGISEIEKIIGKVDRSHVHDDGGELASPGLLTKHYSPHTPLILGTKKDVEDFLADGEKVAWMTFSDTQIDHDDLYTVRMPKNPPEYAATLYKDLHEIDEEGFDVIVVEQPPMEDAWLGVRDRLMRASYDE